MTGNLLRVANSPFFCSRQPIRTIARAITHLGIEMTANVLLASTLQPFFSSPKMRSIWKHSLRAADVARRIASLTRDIDPGEAFVVGLVHDIGKLLIALLPPEAQAPVDRACSAGCQASASELVFLGFDHAAVGGDVLRHWNFSAEMADAVRVHHAPERSESSLACVLYLTEYWLDAEEDLASVARLQIALERTGLSLAQLAEAGPDAGVKAEMSLGALCG
jgi:HD-like signal output (HDOD) protein